MPDVPTCTCWRCGSECDVSWVDVSTPLQVQVIRGRTTCTDERCVGRFDQAADCPPSPEQLERRGQQALDTVRAITLEALQ